jgi:hypothetical protein
MSSPYLTAANSPANRWIIFDFAMAVGITSGDVAGSSVSSFSRKTARF